MQLKSSGNFAFIVGLITQLMFDYALGEKKVLATVPNMNVLLNDVLFMEVLQPSEIRYTFKIRLAKNFGISFRKYQSIELAIAEPYHGCTHLSNTHLVKGRIVLIQRGECSFVTKAINAEQAGAVGVVITDNDVNNDHAFIDMIDDNTDRTVGIPATFLLGKDGNMIKNTLDRLHQQYAVITIPINITGANVYHVNQPPWTLW
ncbi:protease-associated domain-containing protein 1-like isoform X2 [Ruditapes philippinarum]|uniref:protease-associated domain-containing protein 1-like isoform X2 n=1 Tax=Ruditapes philippinarum TaxID=129788 RepID=UPI00295A77DE|nr:protease-associated domain-containing protein 1-like isoform X2 [Ruditapes philippinarum]